MAHITKGAKSIKRNDANTTGPPTNMIDPLSIDGIVIMIPSIISAMQIPNNPMHEHRRLSL